MILAIDSSNRGFSACLKQADSLVFSINSSAAKSQYLITELKAAFENAGIKITGLKKIIVNLGPGSFTGIRTSLTLVKTLEANLELEVYPVNNFQLLRFLNPDIKEFAFRESAKNDKEFFVSLDENYENLETNFFTNELDTQLKVLDLPETQEMAKTLLDYFCKQDKKLAQTEIKPYYLREPSLRLPRSVITSATK